MATKKAALGKGLNALLPSSDPEVTGEVPSEDDLPKSRLYRFEDRENRLVGKVTDIEIENIRPNPYQPRRDFDEVTLEELAASIQQLGIIQPITVRALGGGLFEIISGERRLRAARRAGLQRIPAYVREADTEEMLEMALVENVQRESLNPIEVAHGYQRLIEECNLTQERVAQKVGKNRATIANFLRLLKLPPRLQAALRDQSVTMGHARALINLSDEAEQVRLLGEIQDNGASVREIEDRVRAWHQAQEEKEKKKAEPPEPKTARRDLFTQTNRDALQIEDFTGKLRARLSTQVLIKHRQDGSGGKIEISYYSDEDLDRLIELLR